VLAGSRIPAASTKARATDGRQKICCALVKRSLVSFLVLSVVGLKLLAHGQSSVAVADRLNEPWWKARHEHCLRMTQFGRADVAFLGDSITQFWEGPGQDIWDRQIAPFKAANFGFSGDQTSHVLWRLQNGELLGIHPKLIVLMIGTNDIGQGKSPEQTADGVRAIVSELRSQTPSSKILLLGIFPRGAFSTDPLRQEVAHATELFKDCVDGSHVQFLDIGTRFLAADGSLPAATFPDALHPNTDGYKQWADAIVPTIARMTGKPIVSYGG